MSVSLAIVESQALELSLEERVELANRLLSSLAQDPEIGEAWAAEVEHRLVEVESGRMALVVGPAKSTSSRTSFMTARASEAYEFVAIFDDRVQPQSCVRP